MNGPRHRRRMLAGLTLTALALGACASDQHVTKAGGGDNNEPITLRFGTDDFPGRPGADQIDEFARRVTELTDGDVRIQGVWYAGRDGDGRNWDQHVAQKVIDGELDGANVPARAWDLMNVTSMQAFHAPFLITDDAAMNAVLGDATITDDMLAGLAGTGVTGLGIVPDSIRYLFGFREPFPLTTAAGFDTALIRTPASATAWATFEALGATPDDLPDLDAAIADGSLTAMESTFGFVDGNPNTSALGNLPLFPKANVLVINDEVFDQLSDTQRSALRTTANETSNWAITNNPTAATAAAAFCTARGSIIHADPTEIDAIHERATIALDELTADETIAATIDRISAIIDGVTASPVPAACAPAESPGATEPATLDVEALTGTYRFELAADDMRARGVPEAWFERNEFYGEALITITLADGIFTAEDRCQTCPGSPEINAVGTYTASGDVVTFRIDEWASHWTMSPTVTDDGITWTFVDSLPPWAGDEDKLVDAAYWTTHPWIRIS